MINTTSNDTNEWNGLDVDIVKYICNTTISYSATETAEIASSFLDCVPLDQVYLTTTLDDRLDAVINGDADFSIGAISVTPEREELVDFIRPFYYAVGSVMLGPDGSAVSEWQDLKGEVFCTWPGYHAVQALQEEYGASGAVFVKDFVEAREAIANETCSVLIIDTQRDPSSANLKRLNTVVNFIGASPYGIAVSKTAPESLVKSLVAAAVSMLWSGTESALWGFVNETMSARENLKTYGTTADVLGFATSAITGFLTENGNRLDFSNMPVLVNVGTSLAVPPAASPAPYNATIAVYKGNSLPLARIDGNATFLEEGSKWEGIEIEILDIICSSSVIQCTGVVVADTVDERLSLLEDNTADISIGSIVVTQERLDEVAFIQPFYFSAGPALYMPANGSLPSAEDATMEYMDGKNVCTVTGSAQNPAGESYGAILIPFDTRAAAEAAIYKGECIGLLWVSHVYFEGLIEVATDTSKEDPIGIAVNTNLPLGAYSYLSALLAQLMSQGRQSDMILWEQEYKKSATANPLLLGVTDAITNFDPTLSQQSEDIVDDVVIDDGNQQETSGTEVRYGIWSATLLIAVLLVCQ
eukprot:jgi/Picsp_1/3177/NSC_06017-R1_glutamine-binding protein